MPCNQRYGMEEVLLSYIFWVFFLIDGIEFTALFTIKRVIQLECIPRKREKMHNAFCMQYESWKNKLSLISPTDDKLHQNSRLSFSAGAVGPSLQVHQGLDLKQIQLDSMGYLVSRHLQSCAHFDDAGELFNSTLRFFGGNYKEVSSALINPICQRAVCVFWGGTLWWCEFIHGCLFCCCWEKFFPPRRPYATVHIRVRQFVVKTLRKVRTF